MVITASVLSFKSHLERLSLLDVTISDNDEVVWINQEISGKLSLSCNLKDKTLAVISINVCCGS